MAWKNLHEDIEAEFAGLVVGFDLSRDNDRDGFHVLAPARPRGNYLANKRRWAQKDREAEVRARLLAGERPPLRKGPGRPPKLWFKVAKELGIDLGVANARPA